MPSSPSSTKIRTKFMVPVAGAILLLLAAFAYQAYTDRTKMIDREVKTSFRSAQSFYKKQVEETAELIGTAIEVLMKDKEIRIAWENQDRAKLFSLTSPLLDEIRLKHRITHFYFHDKNRNCFLRVYNPDKFGDKIERETLIHAQQTGKPAHGLEIGFLGTFTLRVVYPYRIGGEVVGYVEMGEEIDQIAHKIHDLLGLEIYTFIQKRYLTRANWEEGMKILNRQSNWDDFKDVVLVSHTLGTVPDSIEVFDPENSRFLSGHTQLWLEDRSFLDNHMLLKNARGEVVGEWILLHDITQQIGGFRKAMINTTILCLLVAIALLGFFYVFLGKVERKLELARKRELQAEMAQAEKMASLGVLISGVAHEINNPTNFITFNAPLLDRVCKGIQPILEEYHNENGDFSVAGLSYEDLKSELPKMVQGISQAGERIRKIVAELKDFSRKENREHFKAVDLHSVLESSLQFMQAKLEEATSNFEKNYTDSLPKIFGDYHRLEQVFKNLLENACEALTNKKQAIRLSTRYDRNENKIVVEIHDEGRGIPEDLMPKIKDPFFTTKQDKGGTGLGLSVSYSIIQAHGGKLEFTSPQGKGATVKVILPAMEDGDV